MTPTPELEAVARAICEQDGDVPDAIRPYPWRGPVWETCIETAHAALDVSGIALACMNRWGIEITDAAATVFRRNYVTDPLTEAVARALAKAKGIEICSDATYSQSSFRAPALAAIAAMREQLVPQWQPIETAPTDWTDVLVFSPEHEGFNCGGVFSAFFDTEARSWSAHEPGGNIALNPTHWMPLPAAPTEGEG